MEQRVREAFTRLTPPDEYVPEAEPQVRQGLVALGDSITRGRGGAPALGVHPQSWAQWTAEALELPYSNFAADGALASDVVAHQIPRLRGPYDVATLFVGANDARGMEFDAVEFEDAIRETLEALVDRADRVLVLTIPLDLGRPRAGEDVVTANGILRRVADDLGAIVCPLENLRGPRVMLPDAVHPTSAGMVAIADRAVDALARAGLRVVQRPGALADARTDRAAQARYALWYAKQVVRDYRRRLSER